MADLVYPPVLLVGYGAFATLGLKVRVHGGEHLPRKGGAVLASSHVSYLDFIFAGYAARPSDRLVRFMAKESVFRHPVAGPIMRSMKHIPVDRKAGAASYSHAVESLQSGEVVGVFPEATMSRSFEPKAFKTGAVRMADEAGVPLDPDGAVGHAAALVLRPAIQHEAARRPGGDPRRGAGGPLGRPRAGDRPAA